jgi:hypothetical protein
MRGKPFVVRNKLAKGRPRGSKNRKTRFLESFQIHGGAIIDKCKLLALNGNVPLLRSCLERLVPIAKPQGTPFRLPAIQTAADWKKRCRAFWSRFQKAA